MFVALIGSLVGSFMKVDEGSKLYGVVPIRAFNAIFGGALFCFLYFAYGGLDPNGIY
jgi:hypothetical protein